jgi:hypothetical protein
LRAPPQGPGLCALRRTFLASDASSNIDYLTEPTRKSVGQRSLLCCTVLYCTRRPSTKMEATAMVTCLWRVTLGSRQRSFAVTRPVIRTGIIPSAHLAWRDAQECRPAIRTAWPATEGSVNPAKKKTHKLKIVGHSERTADIQLIGTCAMHSSIPAAYVKLRVYTIYQWAGYRTHHEADD